MRNVSFITLLLTGTILAGCSLAPTFKMPEMGVPQAYKESLPDTEGELAKGRWREAASMEETDRGQWWKMFGDAKLDVLEDEAIAANQSLKAAAARVQQARAIAEGVRPSYLPDLDIGFNPVRSKPPGAALAAFGNPGSPEIKPYTLYGGQGVLSYEADLFGSVRDNYKASLFESQAEEATYRSALLALQADVAEHYFSIRALDTERKLMRETVDIRAEAARIMRRRFEVGSAGEADMTRTQSELAGVKAELTLLDSRRTQLEHALAVLLGKMPSDFTMAEAPLEGVPPLVPAGLPSELLQRRPDIATAIAGMKAANKRIGVARAAFFPKVTLTASGGFQSTELGDLFKWSSRTWALGQTAGSAVAMSVFNSGRNFADLDASKAAYEESVANYRQQVLLAFRDVEDNLNAQRQLAEQLNQLEIAANTSTRTTGLTSMRYEQGDVDYFQVVDAQRISLSAQRSAVQALGQRYVTTVSLVRALGGGWDVTEDQPKAVEATPAPTMPQADSVAAPSEQPAELAQPEPKEEIATEIQPEAVQPEMAPAPLLDASPTAEKAPSALETEEALPAQGALQEQPKEVSAEDVQNVAEQDTKKNWWDRQWSFDAMPDIKLDVVPAAAAIEQTAGKSAPNGTVLNNTPDTKAE